MGLQLLSCILCIAILSLVFDSCAVIPRPIPTATPEILSKQPEPSRPRIAGQFSGLPANALVTITIRTPLGRKAVSGTRRGNTFWESVVTEASGVDYIVTAEAEGYVSQPISYTIHISGDTAYVVRDGQVTDEEAIHLDFHFVPKDSP